MSDVQSATVPCVLCGRGPTTLASVRRHIGMLIVQRFYKLREPLCRECGLKATKQWTLKTLWQGWWGLISFFFNFFVLLANAAAALKFRKLDPPGPARLP